MRASYKLDDKIIKNIVNIVTCTTDDKEKLNLIIKVPKQNN